jgi:hypothetical protein
MKNQYDEQSVYCRMLGHDVQFSYCRKPGKNLVCRRIADCWFTKIDIETYLKENYSSEELTAAFAPPKPKMTTLMELVAKAKEG